MGEVVRSKKLYPMQIAEVTISEGIYHKPDANWWVKYLLKKSDRIVASVRKWQAIYSKNISLA